MSKSIKLKDETYLDSSSVTHNNYGLNNLIDKDFMTDKHPNIMCNRRENDALTNVDLNDYRQPGFYGLYGANRNAPAYSDLYTGYGVLEVIAYSSSHIVQILHEADWAADRPKIWSRFSEAGGNDSVIWSPWQRMMYANETHDKSLWEATETSGYNQLSSGLIIQWGVTTGTGYRNFPKRFPNKCVMVISVGAHAGNTNPHYITNSGAVWWDAGGFYIVSAGYHGVGQYQTDVAGDSYYGSYGNPNFAGPSRYIALGY